MKPISIHIKEHNPEFYIDRVGPLAIFCKLDNGVDGSREIKLQWYDGGGLTWTDVAILFTLVPGGQAVWSGNLASLGEVVGKYRIYLGDLAVYDDRVEAHIFALGDIRFNAVG